MKIRKLISLLLLFSFIVLLLSSIVLYVMPHGRVAYWADWRLIGLDKEAWDNLHINSGLLFVLAGIWHTFLNLKPLLNYLGKSAGKLRQSPREAILALVLTVLLVLGTLGHWPLFSLPLRFNAALKDRADLTYGIPPYGHAELSSLAEFCQRTRLEVESSLAKIRAAGYQAEGPKQTIVAMARANRISPQKLFQVFKPAPVAGGEALPEFPPPGFGRLTIRQIAETYNRPLAALESRLRQAGIEPNSEKRFMELARENGREPLELYKLLR